MELLTYVVASNVVNSMIRSKWILTSLYDTTFGIASAWNFITISKTWAKNLDKHTHISEGRCWCDENAVPFKLQRVRAELNDFMNYRAQLAKQSLLYAQFSQNEVHSVNAVNSPNNTHQPPFSQSVITNLDQLMHIFTQIIKQINIVRQRFEQSEKASFFQLTYWKTTDISDCMKQFDRLFPCLDYQMELFLQACRDEQRFVFQNNLNPTLNLNSITANNDHILKIDCSTTHEGQLINKINKTEQTDADTAIVDFERIKQILNDDLFSKSVDLPLPV